jgi:hypothetical protein
MNQPLTDDQARLLATFADGPKIWDERGLFEIVGQLHDLGLVRFVGDGPKAEITEAGRQALT